MAEVAGHPLIHYSLEVAKKVIGSRKDSTIFVSTDSEEIKAYAEGEGIEVPFLRPDEFAGDLSPSIEFVVHALREFAARGQTFQSVILLQPTSPLRPVNAVQEAIRMMEENPEADSLITAFEDPTLNLDTYYHCSANGYAMPVTDAHNKGGRRQDVAPVYVRNGAVYIVRTEYLERTQRLIADIPLVLVMDAGVSVNVDGPEELKQVREILEA